MFPFEIGNKVAIPVNVMHGDLQVLVIALMILPSNRCENNRGYRNCKIVRAKGISC
jgi:hypothetical protein